jgi:hypothetical protein
MDEYCDIPVGFCNIPDVGGVCKPRPTVCSTVFDPVCGCDNVTYSNECFAVLAGVALQHLGACEKICGGIAGFACDADEFCEFPVGSCNLPDITGICKPRPDVCPTLFEPVCGCDNVTYPNDCAANLAGVIIQHNGSCETICGGFAGFACDDTEFCDFPVGSCNLPDITGVCKPRPDACPTVFEPVCGCDNVTYPNDCAAILAGVIIQRNGSCEKICGGFAPTELTCNSDEFCDFPIGSCNIADLTGTCQPRVDQCSDVVEPVCGCDGVTYPNACLANQANARISALGEC